MTCPNGCGELAQGRNKGTYFSDGDNDLYLTIYLEWCPECGYIGLISSEYD